MPKKSCFFIIWRIKCIFKKISEKFTKPLSVDGGSRSVLIKTGQVPGPGDPKSR
jgi:hypothetical protein